MHDAGMKMLEHPVHLVTVRDEGEAEVVCGLLRASGINSGWNVTNMGIAGVSTFGGAREVVVGRSDLEAAQAVLARAP